MTANPLGKGENMDKTLWGYDQNKQEIYKYTIENASGTKATLTNYGAILLDLFVPVNGSPRDITLGYTDLDSYFGNDPCFGAIVCRHANRIGGASFSLNGTTYTLAKNDNDNNLHSGPDNSYHRIWNVTKHQFNSITFSLESPDGDQGFPGKMTMSVTYTVEEDTSLSITYKGISDKDTVFNPTFHGYFNLDGMVSDSILNHKLFLNCTRFTPTDEYSIPHGEIASVSGTPMDFTAAKEVGQDIGADFNQLKWAGGYDHNFIIDQSPETLSEAYSDDDLSLFHAATLSTDQLSVEVYTDLPGIQVYSGNYIQNEKGKATEIYNPRSGIALETQYYPNAVNIPEFPQPIIKAGEESCHKTVYHFV